MFVCCEMLLLFIINKQGVCLLQVVVVYHLSIWIPALTALQMFCQLEDQMEKRQYYEALKTLEQLEHSLLPQISGYVQEET